MEIRSEAPADRPAVLRLTEAAFQRPASASEPATAELVGEAGPVESAGSPGTGQPAGTAGPVEPRLLAELFDDAGYLPELSIVAVQDGAVVGHAIATRGHIGIEPALGLGPIAVEPALQGRGIGGALLGELRRRAAALGERVIVLLGHPEYYPRFGYRPAADFGIAAPDPAWGANFMALDLGNGPVPAGTFRYAAPFNGV